jgi:hypothetical protein
MEAAAALAAFDVANPAGGKLGEAERRARAELEARVATLKELDKGYEDFGGQWLAALLTCLRPQPIVIDHRLVTDHHNGHAASPTSHLAAPRMHSRSCSFCMDAAAPASGPCARPHPHPHPHRCRNAGLGWAPAAAEQLVRRGSCTSLPPLTHPDMHARPPRPQGPSSTAWCGTTAAPGAARWTPPSCTRQARAAAPWRRPPRLPPTGAPPALLPHYPAAPELAPRGACLSATRQLWCRRCTGRPARPPWTRPPPPPPQGGAPVRHLLLRGLVQLRVQCLRGRGAAVLGGGRRGARHARGRHRRGTLPRRPRAQRRGARWGGWAGLGGNGAGGVVAAATTLFMLLLLLLLLLPLLPTGSRAQSTLCDGKASRPP